MPVPQIANIGGFIKPIRSHSYRITAGGGGGAGETADNTAVNGVALDRWLPGGASGAGNASAGVIGSATFCLFATATLAAGKKLDVIAVHKESADDGAADAYANLANAQQPAGDTTTVWLNITDGGAGSTASATKEQDLDFAGNKRYVRSTLTADLNAANTDVATIAAVWVAGGVSEGKALPLV